MISLAEVKTLKCGVYGICPICGASQFVHKRYDAEPEKVRCISCLNPCHAGEWKTESGATHWNTDNAPSKMACRGIVVLEYGAYKKRYIDPTYEELYDWVNSIYNPFENEKSFFEGIEHIKDNKYRIIMEK